MSEPRAITDLAEKARRLQHRAQSRAALNNAIALMAHDWSLPEIVDMLREFAKQIEELG
jgi:hypothetical protein